MTRSVHFVVMAAMLAPRIACAALATTWEYDFDAETKPWKELQAQLPAYPRPQDLILLEAGSETPHKFYIDAKSVSVGVDDVVRYTTVVKTAGGATNVTFEGMRCDTREQKLYALGRSDGSWGRARDPKWQRIVLRDLQPHHYVLYRDFFCPARAKPTPLKQALDALKRGTPLGRTNID
jgi:hypothetical protein